MIPESGNIMTDISLLHLFQSNHLRHCNTSMEAGGHRFSSFSGLQCRMPSLRQGTLREFISTSGIHQSHIRDKTLALAFALSLLAFSIFSLALGRVVVLILALSNARDTWICVWWRKPQSYLTGAQDMPTDGGRSCTVLFYQGRL